MFDTDQSPDWMRVRNEANRLLDSYRVSEPPVPVLRMAEDAGLRVAYARLPPDRRSVSGFIDVSAQQIVVNADEAPVRQIYTVAHELGHWLLHRSQVISGKFYRVLTDEPLDGPKPTIEREADGFAADLLVPVRLLNRLQQNTASWPNQSSLARLFGVSEDVIRYRLRTLYGW